MFPYRRCSTSHIETWYHSDQEELFRRWVRIRIRVIRKLFPSPLLFWNLHSMYLEGHPSLAPKPWYSIRASMKILHFSEACGLYQHFRGLGVLSQKNVKHHYIFRDWCIFDEGIRAGRLEFVGDVGRESRNKV